MVDYSKWKDIEISDDEDDTHPNIDTPSLFRWRHQARLERMAEKEKEKERLLKEKNEYEKRVENLKKKLQGSDGNAESTDMTQLKEALQELEKKGQQLIEHEKELEKKDRVSNSFLCG
nr:hsp90 co-chaperone Cdc37-like [Penaeus vannamei]